MTAIVHADGRTYGIGKDGNLLRRIPDDMAFFRRKTEGKTVIMGRGTFDSLPGGKTLSDRKNIVLTRNKGFLPPDAQVCHSLESLLYALSGTPEEDIFVIGGESVYRLLLPYCAKALVTKSFSEKDAQADCFFPNLDFLSGWSLTSSSELMRYNDIKYQFCEYVNAAPLSR